MHKSLNARGPMPEKIESLVARICNLFKAQGTGKKFLTGWIS